MSETIVFKVGTSTLIHETGRLNLQRMEELVEVISDIMNRGNRVALVTSGAIGVGVGKLGLCERPKDTAAKQAVSTVGQCELMFMYDKMFAQYSHKVGQLLITKKDIADPKRHENLVNAFEKLFYYGAIPIVNENDAVAVEEIVFGDNDSLSAEVAVVIKADRLIMMTETDGLYDSNPFKNPEAKRISCVEEIDDKIRACAGESTSDFGTGGMITKIHAAQRATEAGIETYVVAGSRPKDIYRLLEGEDIGTHFKAVKKYAD
jgi:glutamate 5-kinase